MKKIITLSLISLSTLLYSGDKTSCLEMSEQELSIAIDRYQNSINLSHFKTEEMTDSDKKHVKSSLQNSVKIQKCIHLQNIKKYNNNDDRKYRSLLKLQSFLLTTRERNFRKEAIKQSKTYFHNHSNASFIDKNSCSYPLLYLTAQNSKKGGVILYEYRLIGGKVKQYHRVLQSMTIKPTCGNRNSISNYIAYLRKEKKKNFTLAPPKNAIDNINQKVKENIYRHNHHNFSTEYRIISDLKVKSFTEKNLYITIPKDEIINYLNHYQKENLVFSYRNKKYIITLSKWRKYMRGDGKIEF